MDDILTALNEIIRDVTRRRADFDGHAVLVDLAEGYTLQSEALCDLMQARGKLREAQYRFARKPE